MRMGKGLGLTLPRREWHPASLFASSEAGFWGGELAPGAGNLWQDTARTTQVTAAGDPVGAWRLHTAGADIYATQATAANRPTLQQDGARWYLSFDGSSDSLATSAINLTGSDEMFVVAGVRKGSDATQGMLLEFSAAIASNAGAFSLQAPRTAATANYGFLSRGDLNTAVAASAASFAAPHVAVLTGRADISTDSCTLRVNGTQVGTASNDQGNGNYGNHVLYIGARAGTSLHFNGRLYGLLVRARSADSAQIAAAEHWMNQRTGAF